MQLDLRKNNVIGNFHFRVIVSLKCKFKVTKQLISKPLIKFLKVFKRKIIFIISKESITFDNYKLSIRILSHFVSKRIKCNCDRSHFAYFLQFKDNCFLKIKKQNKILNPLFWKFRVYVFILCCNLQSFNDSFLKPVFYQILIFFCSKIKLHKDTSKDIK